MLVLDLSQEPTPPAVDDIIQYRPIDAWNHNTETGEYFRVVEVRDTVVKPLKYRRRRVKRSRYLLTCVNPKGEYRAFYHIHAIPAVLEN